MIVHDPGHIYQLEMYNGSYMSGDEDEILHFMKREGAGYPGNVGHHAGTNIQEVLRALIDRTKYLNNQVPHVANLVCIDNFRNCIYVLEHRAAERHKRVLPNLRGREIESIPVCHICGHIFCEEHK